MSTVTPFPQDARAIETPAVEGIPLADLYLSPMNPRQNADPEGIAHLADSIATIGLIQSLAGFRGPEGKVGIVAGGRRLRALELLIERNPDLIAHRPELAFVPVRLAADEDTARAWASVENSAREDLHPADEIRAFGRMRDAGADVPRIARVFGTTEAHVCRRLALADLPAPVLDALRAGEIGLGIARTFTICNDPDLILRVLADARGRDLSEHSIRRALLPDAVSAADRRARFVGIEAYEAAGGSLSRDLFAAPGTGETLTNPALLDRLFAEKLEAEAARASAGWKWFETREAAWLDYSELQKMGRLYPEGGDLSEEQAERYEELADLANAGCLDEDGAAELDALQVILDGDFTDAQRAQAGCIVHVDRDGDLTAVFGLVRPEDRAAIEAGGSVSNRNGSSGIPAQPKPPYTAALVEDMKAIRLHAVQAALLAKPDMVLDLLAFGLSGEGGFDRVFGIRPETGRNCPTITEGLDADPRLSEPEREGYGYPDDEGRIAAFRAFAEKGKKHRNATITAGIARTLPYPVRGDGFFAMVEDMTGADLRQVWTPTAENFFSRVSAGYLENLLVELTGTDRSGTGFRAFAAMKKKDKAALMERLFSDPATQAAWQIDAEKKARIDAWRPDCF